MGRTIQVNPENFGSSNDPIPLGERLKVSVYDIDEAVVKSGDNAGKPQLVLTVKVTEPGPYQGREIRYNNIPLYAARNAWTLVAFADAVGLKTDRDSGNVELPDNIGDLRGKEFIAKMGHRTGNDGNIYNTVAGYAKIKSGGTETQTPTTTKKWSEL